MRKTLSAALLIALYAHGTLAAYPEGTPVQATAVTALESTSRPAEASPAVVGELGQASKAETDPDARLSAVVSMGQFQHGEALATLTKVLGSSEEQPEIRAAAAVSLGRQGVPESAAVLAKFARDPQPLVRRHAVLGLGLLKAKSKAADVTALLGDPDKNVRATAASALAMLGSPESLDRLKETARRDPDPRARQAALTSLGQIGDSSVAGVLEEAAREEPDAEAKKAAEHALAALGQKEIERDGTAPETIFQATDVVAESSTVEVPRTTDTANGESGAAIPGEPLPKAIQRMAARLAPGSGATREERLRLMHELCPLIDQAAFLGAKTVPLSPPKGRWYLTAHEKPSEHEDLVKTTFVNEAGALFREGDGKRHLPGSSYVVFRFENANKKPGRLAGIGAYTYTRQNNPVFKHFGLDGRLDSFSTRKVNRDMCFTCHDNQTQLKHGLDFTFDTFERAAKSGVVKEMEMARTRVQKP